ncbi:DUF3987 domain-containing protein [Gloeothece verrucosa]|uniref:DnaB domain protein helicase domain protein n=1 Tax=Gloeothece verrucosa (strain PCC 7822) TaxID=497965 RepID=E0UL97_GLOV7|nr:DUF3987 domain-containing protein [Gloeothece verrucosa]ADN17727.1 DnaB domain protein helicase domain protein [Gloeothece verrucosa PCC 7822]
MVTLQETQKSAYLANPEAEELILGGILFDPRAMAKVADLLSPEHFYVRRYAAIYETALELYQSGLPTDLMTVQHRLEEKGICEQVGGISQLAQLIERTVSAANIDVYARNIVRKHWEKRELQSLSHHICEWINDPNYSPNQIQELIINQAQALNTASGNKSTLQRAIAGIQQILQRKDLTELEQKIKLEELRESLKIQPNLWKNECLMPAKQELAVNNLISLTSKSSLDILELLDRIKDRNLSESELEIELRALAQLSNYQLYDLRKLYQQRCYEHDLNFDELELATSLPQLIALHKKGLDIRKILPPQLAATIINTANAMPTAVEAIFTHLLPVWAASIGTAARIIVKVSSRYIQPCILRTMVVANSGDRKSPALDNATEALEQIEDEAYTQYQQQLSRYVEEVEEWYSSKKDERGPKPKEPICKRFVTRDVNYEGSIRLHEQNPRGLLNKVDELAGYFKRMNKFRNGHGDDDTLDLTLFGGKTYSKDRKGESTYLRRTAISATGTIQWLSLAELQAKFSDSDYTGALARWLVCATELPAPYLDLLHDCEDFGLNKINRNLIEWLHLLPEQDYILSPEAKVIFQKWQHQLVKKMKAESITALEVAYPKFESYCVRIALVLHLVWAWSNGSVEPSVSGETMKRAIYVINWYIQQLRYVLAKNSPALACEGNALIVKELLAKKTELTMRDARRGSRRLKELNDSQLKSIFRALVEAGLANYVPAKTLKIRSLVPTDTNVNLSDRVAPVDFINPLASLTVKDDQQMSTLIKSLNPSSGEDQSNLGVTQENPSVNFETTLVDNIDSSPLSLKDKNVDSKIAETQLQQGIESVDQSMPVNDIFGLEIIEPNKIQAFDYSLKDDVDVTFSESDSSQQENDFDISLVSTANNSPNLELEQSPSPENPDKEEYFSELENNDLNNPSINAISTPVPAMESSNTPVYIYEGTYLAIGSMETPLAAFWRKIISIQPGSRVIVLDEAPLSGWMEQAGYVWVKPIGFTEAALIAVLKAHLRLEGPSKET